VKRKLKNKKTRKKERRKKKKGTRKMNGWDAGKMLFGLA
jgi:hypothetical protein